MDKHCSQPHVGSYKVTLNVERKPHLDIRLRSSFNCEYIFRERSIESRTHRWTRAEYSARCSHFNMLQQKTEQLFNF